MQEYQQSAASRQLQCQDIAATSTWEPLSLRRILRHFPTLSCEASVEKALQNTDALLPQEKEVLRFLHAVFGGSQSTIQLYARYW